MATELANKKAEREALRGVIQQWNANRLDLFELSEPNEVKLFLRFSDIPSELVNLNFIYLILILGFGVSRCNEILFSRQRSESGDKMY